jgi:serine/threonine-protein kinase
VGKVINGRYELGDRLGAGGMGSVFRAHDRKLDRAVALKLVHTENADDEVGRARLKAEARLAGGVHHPNVAEIFDYDEDTETGAPFLVMRLVEGEPLSQVLRRERTLAPGRTMGIVADVAEALAAAHALGVVHRDVKPSNILLTDDRAVLVDFGIARSPESEPLTSTGTLLGTVDYLSPEQALGRSAAPPSDVYALGVVAHHCLTGAPPFRRESPVATAIAHAKDNLPPLGDDVPGGVRALVARLTAKDPDDRPDAEAVAVTASALADGHRTDAAPAPRDVGVPVLDELPTAVTRTRPRTRAMAVGAAAAAVVALLAGRELLGSDPEVPDVVGMSVGAASSLLRDEGFAVERVAVDDPRAPMGQVVAQTPEPTEDADDETVELSVASGMVALDARPLVGHSYEHVARRLEALGLVPVRHEHESASRAGRVLSVERDGRVALGTTVPVVVAIAPVQEPAATAGASASASKGTSSVAPRATGPGPGKGSKPGKGRAKGKGKGKGRG